MPRCARFPECQAYGPAIGSTPEGRTVVVACPTAPDGEQVAVFRSVDAGQSFAREATLHPDGGTLHVAVAVDGSTVILGAVASVGALAGRGVAGGRPAIPT